MTKNIEASSYILYNMNLEKFDSQRISQLLKYTGEKRIPEGARQKEEVKKILWVKCLHRNIYFQNKVIKIH